MNCEIEKLREKLNNTLKVENIDSDNVLSLSKKLDILILEYYKPKNK